MGAPHVDAAPRAYSAQAGQYGPAARWGVVLLVLAALVGGVLLMRPTGGAAVATGPSHGDALRVSAADLPTHCGAAGTRIGKRVTADLDHDGRTEQVVSARCQAEAGSPPDGLYVFSAGPSGRARLVTVLLDPKQKMTVRALSLAHGRLRARLAGYSSDTVPRYRPDLLLWVHWKWHAGEFSLVPEGPDASSARVV